LKGAVLATVRLACRIAGFEENRVVKLDWVVKPDLHANYFSVDESKASGRTCSQPGQDKEKPMFSG